MKGLIMKKKGLIIGLLVVIAIGYFIFSNINKSELEKCGRDKDCIYKIFEDVLFWKNDYVSKWDLTDAEANIFNIILLCEKERFENDKRMVDKIIKDNIQPYIPFKVKTANPNAPISSVIIIHRDQRGVMSVMKKYFTDILGEPYYNEIINELDEETTSYFFLADNKLKKGDPLFALITAKYKSNPEEIKNLIQYKLIQTFISSSCNNCDINIGYDVKTLESVMKFLYKLEIKAGMSKQEFKKVFYKIY
jgi:hypothetical protein